MLQVQTDADDKEFQLVEDNSPKLLQFLRGVEPMVSKALMRNAQSTAFDGNSVLVNWLLLLILLFEQNTELLLTETQF